MASVDARPIPKRNVALRLTFPIVGAGGDPVSGATGLDTEISQDGAAFADATNEATEIGSSGWYTLDLTAAEMDANTVAIDVASSTAGARRVLLTLYPEEAGDIRATAVITDVDSTGADAMADALLDRSAGVETGLTMRQWFRLAAGLFFSKCSGVATATAAFRDYGDTKDRLTYTTDADGNRTAVTRDPS